ncbi:lamina-associated polypeptide 2, isoforms beta/gamma-like [Xyrauchen texanus]|uniref:lamina-associated polypeptide 2, isoforms beta/gamma-like n=1 Tax=Xyrauchen texanus TaxID=154827 RepID=UPI002241FE3A|nr:lamina-associated polypeptide 2, isoforms beta/gamma-like [Xyrauchen texanus]
MSEFLEDPSMLTKDKLKSVLLAHNVALPNGDQKKDVYVQLYLKNLTAQNKKSSSSPDVFSSDDELPPAPMISNKSRSGRKATRKTDKVRPEDIDVTELSNEGLKDLLLKYGSNAGPIVASTRKVYEKKLQKLLDQGPPEAVAPTTDLTRIDGNQNGNTDSDQYSDKDEEAPAPVSVPEPVVEAEPIPVVERLVRSRGKTPVTTRTRSSQHNREEDEEEEYEEDWPVLNVKRKPKRLSHRPDQAVPASDDTENSELSPAEFFPVSKDRRRTGPVAVRKEPRPLLADKTSKLSSKTESLKRRSAPVHSVRPDLKEAAPTYKDFSEPSIVKEVSGPLVRIKANPLAVPKEPKPSMHSSLSGFDRFESPKHHGYPFQSTVSDLHEEAPIDQFDERAADITSPPIRSSNREPLVSLLNTAHIEVDGHGMQDKLNCRPVIRASVALSQESKSVSVPKNSKHIQPHLSLNKHSKPLIDTMCRLPSTHDGQSEACLSPSLSFRESAYNRASDDLMPMSVIFSQESCGSPETQPKIKQSRITPFTPVRGFDTCQTARQKTAMVEKVSAIDQTPRTVERDVLKAIFPNENLNTPTGISATCRRPIRGAAGRPVVDTKLDESRFHLTKLRETSTSYTETRSVPRVAAVPLTAYKPLAPPALKTRARRGLSVWVQLLLLSAVAGFLFFVYQAMETNEVGLFKQSGADDSTSK